MLKIVTSILLCCFALSSCQSNQENGRAAWRQQNGKLKVLTTTAMIADLVSRVGKDHVDVLVLIKGQLDPHSYQLVKGDDEKLQFADLIFYNGLGLEHGPTLQQYLHGTKKAYPLGDLLMKEEPQLQLYFKGQPDPHIWMDVSLWGRLVPYIVDILSSQDHQHAQDYRANGQMLTRELNEAHAKVKEILHEVPGDRRYLVTSHDAFNYFTRAYLAEPNEDIRLWQERFIAPEGLAPESQISTTDIQATINHLKKYHIRVLFPESNINRDSIRKIVQAAKELGLVVHMSSTPLYADAMGKPGSDGDSYMKMLLHNAKTIADELKRSEQGIEGMAP